MNAAEHFAEAQRIIKGVRARVEEDTDRGVFTPHEDIANNAALAQVHATLSLAAVQAESALFGLAGVRASAEQWRRVVADV